MRLIFKNLFSIESVSMETEENLPPKKILLFVVNFTEFTFPYFVL